MKTVIINPTYAENSRLKSFISQLPHSFTDGGSMLWDGRNKIKRFEIAPDASGKKMVVKRFKRLNIFQQIGCAFRKHKARKAYDNGMMMKSRGIQTPEPIAVAEFRKCCFVKDAYYACEELLGYTEIEKGLGIDQWDKKLTQALASFFAQMHEAGVLHHDMNSTNILYRLKDGEYHFTVIDINRVTFRHSIHEMTMKERIENMTRFTGKDDLFLFFAREYAKACQMPEPDQWVSIAMAQKKQHDLNWDRRKRLLHPFRKTKQRNK